MTRLIAIDPGKEKCGLLLADIDQELVLEGIVGHRTVVIDLVSRWISQGNLEGIVLGNGTTSKDWFRLLKDLAPVQIVQERGTTLRARERYWELWPPSWWLRWLPRGLLLPSKPLDAVAALILLEDHLNKKLRWQGPRNFRIWPEQ